MVFENWGILLHWILNQILVVWVDCAVGMVDVFCFVHTVGRRRWLGVCVLVVVCAGQLPGSMTGGKRLMAICGGGGYL